LRNISEDNMQLVLRVTLLVLADNCSQGDLYVICFHENTILHT